VSAKSDKNRREGERALPSPQGRGAGRPRKRKREKRVLVVNGFLSEAFTEKAIRDEIKRGNVLSGDIGRRKEPGQGEGTPKKAICPHRRMFIVLRGGRSTMTRKRQT